MAEQEARLSPLTVLGDGLLLLCALAGLAGSFLSLYGDGSADPWQAGPLDLCAARTGDLIVLAAVFALVSLAVWSLPRFRWAAAGALLVLHEIAAASRWKSYTSGACVTIQAVSERFAQRVTWGTVLAYDTGLTPAQEGPAAWLFLVMSLTFLALVLGWAVVRARRWWIVLAVTLPPLLPGLLADLYPDWPPFMALAACWCAMLLTDLCKWAAPDRRGVLTLAVLPCVAVVLGAVTLAFPRAGYTRPQWALDAEAGLHDTVSRYAGFFSRWDGPFRSTITYVGSAEEADLASAGPLDYSGRTVLRVRSDYDRGRLYLRGASLAVYEGGTWSALPEGAYQTYLDAGGDSAPASPLLFPALQGRTRAQWYISVENVGAVGSCVYAPYFPEPQDWRALGMLLVEDAYLARRQGQSSFTMTFRDIAPLAGGPSMRDEVLYRDLLQSRYLDVPQQLRGPLLDLCAQDGLYGAAVMGRALDPVETAWAVARLLDEWCGYDMAVSPAPEGTDPVLYFLGESRRGYCMHYASAAALMLRALGVPARYVSGFTTEIAADRQVDVPDRAAHAWVEVWVDGFGWYPVEVTPAAAFDWEQPLPAGPVDLPSEGLEESEGPQATPTPEAAPSAAPSAALPGGADGPEDGPGGAGGALPLAAGALAALLGAAGLLWLVQRAVKRCRAGRLSAPDRRRAALDAYGYLRRLERWGGRMDPRAVELAEKARFSRHTPSEEEREELRRLLDRERERLCLVLDPLPRLAFRCVWGRPIRPKTGENAGDGRENSG